MRNALASAAVTLALAVPGWGGPAEDAQSIVEQSLTREIFEGALRAQRPVLVSAVENDLRQQGITISEPARFFDILVEEFIDEFTETMQEETVAIYLDLFTPEELRDIAAFYATPSGQALLRNTPDLMQAGATLGQKAGEAAGRNAGPRVADRLSEEGIVIDDDPGLTRRLIDALR